MVTYLVDTNIISELRKRERAHPGVLAWRERAHSDQLYVSVIVVGELRRGVELIRRRDTAAAQALERWLDQVVRDFGDRVLDVTARIADQWGRLNVPDPLPVIDGLLAATALVHGHTLVTRNVQDVAPTGTPTLNPFAGDN